MGTKNCPRGEKVSLPKPARRLYSDRIATSETEQFAFAEARKGKEQIMVSLSKVFSHAQYKDEIIADLGEKMAPRYIYDLFMERTKNN